PPSPLTRAPPPRDRGGGFMRSVLSSFCAIGLLAACRGPEDSASESAPPPDDSGRVDDSSPGETGEDSGTKKGGECDLETAPGFLTTSDPTCANPIATGDIALQLEWSLTSWKAQSASSSILSAPIVASLDDDNDDGVVDELDTPDIVLVTFDPLYPTT